MSTTLSPGSIWWSIRPVLESCAEGYTRPARVKLWQDAQDEREGSWCASAFFEETGKVDADSNATRIHRPHDVGRTLFADEESAWAAYLGEAPTPQSIAAELEERAAALEGDAAERSPLAAAHAAALREIAGLLVPATAVDDLLRRIRREVRVWEDLGAAVERAIAARAQEDSPSPDAKE